MPVCAVNVIMSQCRHSYMCLQQGFSWTHSKLSSQTLQPNYIAYIYHLLCLCLRCYSEIPIMIIPHTYEGTILKYRSNTYSMAASIHWNYKSPSPSALSGPLLWCFFCQLISLRCSLLHSISVSIGKDLETQTVFKMQFLLCCLCVEGEHKAGTDSPSCTATRWSLEANHFCGTPCKYKECNMIL